MSQLSVVLGLVWQEVHVTLRVCRACSFLNLTAQSASVHRQSSWETPRSRIHLLIHSPMAKQPVPSQQPGAGCGDRVHRPSCAVLASCMSRELGYEPVPATWDAGSTCCSTEPQGRLLEWEGCVGAIDLQGSVSVPSIDRGLVHTAWCSQMPLKWIKGDSCARGCAAVCPTGTVIELGTRYQEFSKGTSAIQDCKISKFLIYISS